MIGVDKEIEAFPARCDYDSEYLSKANNAVASGCFRGVNLGAEVGKQQQLHKSQFYQALADAKAA